MTRRRWFLRRWRRTAPAVVTRTRLPHRGTWPADPAPPPATTLPGPDELRVQALLLRHLGVTFTGRPR